MLLAGQLQHRTVPYSEIFPPPRREEIQRAKILATCMFVDLTSQLLYTSKRRTIFTCVLLFFSFTRGLFSNVAASNQVHLLTPQELCETYLLTPPSSLSFFSSSRALAADCT